MYTAVGLFLLWLGATCLCIGLFMSASDNDEYMEDK